MKYFFVFKSAAYKGFYHLLIGNSLNGPMDVTLIEFGTAEEIGQIMGGN